jgi:hypothetical protein
MSALLTWATSQQMTPASFSSWARERCSPFSEPAMMNGSRNTAYIYAESDNIGMHCKFATAVRGVALPITAHRFSHLTSEARSDVWMHRPIFLTDPDWMSTAVCSLQQLIAFSEMTRRSSRARTCVELYVYMAVHSLKTIQCQCDRKLPISRQDKRNRRTQNGANATSKEKTGRRVTHRY